MDIQATKYDIIQTVINLNDLNVLRKIMHLLEQSDKKKIAPMSLDEFYERIDAAERAFKDGQLTAHDEMRKEVLTWRKSTNCFKT